MGGMEVVGIGIADTSGRFETRAIEQAVLTYAGLEGDRHAGLTMRSGPRQKHVPRGTELRNSRQLSLVSVEELADIARGLEVPSVRASILGANLLLRGAPELTRVPPGSRLVFSSGAMLVIDGENEPCTKSGRALAQALGVPSVASRFVKTAWGKRGLVAWVERPGLVRVGDTARLVSR